MSRIACVESVQEKDLDAVWSYPDNKFIIEKNGDYLSKVHYQGSGSSAISLILSLTSYFSVSVKLTHF